MGPGSLSSCCVNTLFSWGGGGLRLLGELLFMKGLEEGYIGWLAWVVRVCIEDNDNDFEDWMSASHWLSKGLSPGQGPGQGVQGRGPRSQSPRPKNATRQKVQQHQPAERAAKTNTLQCPAAGPEPTGGYLGLQNNHQ